jgi:competence protein ComEC
VLNDAVLVTLAAQVATLPLLVFYFRQLSIVSLIVNPLVLPAQTGVMVFGLLALGGGLIAIPIGQVLGWLAWVFLAWTLGVIGIFASMPNAAIPVDYVSPIWIAAYYAILLGLTWYLKRPIDQRPKQLAQVITRRNLIVGGGLAAVLIGVAWSWQPDRQLHVIALAVDDHPVVVRTVEGRTILIGGSRSPSGLLAALGGQLPFWERTIDLMIVPRAETMQLNSLVAVLDRYTVKQIMAVKVPTTNRAGSDWRDALREGAQQPIELQRLELEPGVVIDFDQGSVLINEAIAIGTSERAPVSVIAAPTERLADAPQMIFTWSSLPDLRAVVIPEGGTLDLIQTEAGSVSYTLH